MLPHISAKLIEQMNKKLVLQKKSIYSRVHEVAIHHEWENGINFAMTDFREFAKKRSQFSKM